MTAECYPWFSSIWDVFVNSRRISHAHLLHGPTAIGKTQFALQLAHKFLCEVNSGPCGQCTSCKLLLAGTHPDAHLLVAADKISTLTPSQKRLASNYQLTKNSGKSVISIDQIRQLTSQLTLSRFANQLKTIIITKAEDLHPAASNALLKSLEEPAGETIYFLISDHPEYLPATIRSRCQSHFCPIPSTEMAMKWLQPKAQAQSEQVASALRKAAGAPLLAMKILNKSDADPGRDPIADLISLWKGENNPVDLAAHWLQMNLNWIVDCIARWLMQLCLMQMMAGYRGELLPLFHVYDKVLTCKRNLAGSADNRLLIEDVLIACYQVKTSVLTLLNSQLDERRYD